uniref:Uncharacterized protein n=1 Tax=Ananas comosus var. bracteatus TaxID=296719 RepID=A0A6V7PCC9_ANACO|nr:unnamed protein product [Ananas comosus var. bracteatus]
MDLKRALEEEEEGGKGEGLLAREAKRRRTFLNSMREVMGAQYMQRHLSKMEPFLRKVVELMLLNWKFCDACVVYAYIALILVQEEVEKALYRHVRLAPKVPHQIKAASNKRYRLQFQGTLPQTLFTGSKIETENKKPIQVSIFDSASNRIISTGPSSSIQIEIVVLDGDFGTDSQLGWTEKDFSENIVREREGKRPLLTGELVITLSNGLGARVCQNNSGVERVHEAVSEAFCIKDHRGELYKKHHPPALLDDVWRLEKIGKDGVFHKKLADFGIITVQDFLRNLVVDQDRLRRLLGTGMSNKMWEATTEHARECILEDKLYSYCSEQGVVLLFNCIYELVGTIMNGNCYSLDELTATQKVLVNKLQQDAYRFPGHILEFKEQVVNNNASLPSPTDVVTMPMPSLMDQQIPHPAPSIQGNVILEDMSQLSGHDSYPLNLSSFQANSLNVRDLYEEWGSLQPRGLVNPSMAGENVKMGSNFEVDMLSSSPYCSIWDHCNGFIQVSGDKSAHYAARRKWVKLIAVLKWMAVLRRCSARRAVLLNSIAWQWN